MDLMPVSVLDKLNMNKAAGLDMLSVLNVLDIVEIINEIYDSGSMLENLNRFIVIRLPKKLGINRCELGHIILSRGHNQAKKSNPGE